MLALVEKSKKDKSGRSTPVHIPYRNSKLTFLLQDALGGNAKACLIATISPASICVAETVSTLQFAARTKCVQNTAVVNHSDDRAELLALRSQVAELRSTVKLLQWAADHGTLAPGMCFPNISVFSCCYACVGCVQSAPLRVGVHPW
jgi:hypothetical protein